MRPTHNNQIKKEAAKAAPIIQGVMCFVALASGRKPPVAGLVFSYNREAGIDREETFDASEETFSGGNIVL